MLIKVRCGLRRDVDYLQEKERPEALLTLWRDLFFLLSSIAATSCHDHEEVNIIIRG
jgi:hypothetical protein